MHKLVPKRFRPYETIFILTPSINQATADSLTKKFQGLLEQHEGKLTRVSLWGIRKLSYRIKRNDKGIYYQLNYVAPQGFVDEMEKTLRLNDSVLRYLTVQTSHIPMDPSKIVVKGTDVVFGSIDELSEVPATVLEIPDEILTGAPEGAEEEAGGGEEVVEVEAIAAKVEAAAKEADKDDFAELEVEEESETPGEDKTGKNGE
jgi:small subunit ribosomal protein S6